MILSLRRSASLASYSTVPTLNFPGAAPSLAASVPRCTSPPPTLAPDPRSKSLPSSPCTTPPRGCSSEAGKTAARPRSSRSAFGWAPERTAASCALARKRRKRYVLIQSQTVTPSAARKNSVPVRERIHAESLATSCNLLVPLLIDNFDFDHLSTINIVAHVHSTTYTIDHNIKYST